MTASVEEIIERTKRLISLPTDNTLFTPEDYTAFINECIIEEIYPSVMKIRDDYFLVRDVFPLSNGNVNLYPNGVMPIPNRAWGNTLREVRYIDNSGYYYKVNPYFLENLDLYQVKNLNLSSQYQKGYIPFNSGIKLIPPPLSDTGSIEMHYIVTPSTVLNTTTQDPSIFNFLYTIENITFNSSTNVGTYTVNDINTTESYIAVHCPVGSTALFDIYNFKTGMLLATDLAMYRVDNTTFTCTSVEQIGTQILSPNVQELISFQPGGVPVAEPYNPNLLLIPAGETALTPLTPVLDNLLVYELGIKILSAQGYVEELQIFMQKHANLKKNLLSQMAMRVDCEPQVIFSSRGIRSSILFSNFRRKRF